MSVKLQYSKSEYGSLSFFVTLEKTSFTMENLLWKIFAFWAALDVVLVFRKMIKLSVTNYRTPLSTVVIYLHCMCCSLEPKQFQIKLNTSIILNVSRTHKELFSQDVFSFYGFSQCTYYYFFSKLELLFLFFTLRSVP